MADEHLISLQPGTVIAGRYEVVKCLGAGSMGLVYACRHRELSGHMVAVKVLFPEVAQDRVAAARFRNEIFASYGVSHPNVVRAYEYLRDGDIVAYTMEYVGGGDLAERLGKSEEQIAIPDAIRILSQMCSGVQAIHDAGIVHRDLKPENILLTKEGSVKIADFGIARTGQGPRLTEHGGVVGTIDYVSPEYMLNSQVDWRSDIYALGILAYEMVTGESPFRGESVYATMTKRLKSDPAPPSSLRPDCPAELDKIILRAMARNPEERYQAAAEMMYDLQVLMPEQPMNSGAYQVMNRANIKNYVGPSVSAPPENAPAKEEPASFVMNDLNNRAIPDGSMSNGPASHSHKGSSVSVAQMFARGDSSAPVSTSVSRPSHSYDEALVVSSNPGSVAYQYQDMNAMNGMNGKTSSTQRMESVLAAPVNFEQPGVTLTPMDKDRLRKLSESAARSRRSLMKELLIAFIAVLVGVGMGFGVMAHFYPDMLPKNQAVDLIKGKLRAFGFDVGEDSAPEDHDASNGQGGAAERRTSEQRTSEQNAAAGHEVGEVKSGDSSHLALDKESTLEDNGKLPIKNGEKQLPGSRGKNTEKSLEKNGESGSRNSRAAGTSEP